MPRVLCFCLAIVAAFQLPAVAAPVEDIPVPPSVVALAERVGIDFAPWRAVSSGPRCHQDPGIQYGSAQTSSPPSPATAHPGGPQ